MKVMVQASVMYQWEEDSENWSDDDPKSEDELIALAQAYAETDFSYILDCEPASIGKIEIKKVKP